MLKGAARGEGFDLRRGRMAADVRVELLHVGVVLIAMCVEQILHAKATLIETVLDALGGAPRNRQHVVEKLMGLDTRGVELAERIYDAAPDLHARRFAVVLDLGQSALGFGNAALVAIVDRQGNRAAEPHRRIVRLEDAADTDAGRQIGAGGRALQPELALALREHRRPRAHRRVVVEIAEQDLK